MNSTNTALNLKKSMPVRIVSIVSGTLLGAFFCILNVIVALKSGLGFGSSQVVALLGYVFLRVFGISSRTENNIVQAAASGSYLSMFAIDSAVAAGVLFAKGRLSVWMILSIGMMATIVGIILGYYLRGFYIDEMKLPFPTGTATAETINSVNYTSSRRMKHLVLGILIAIVVNMPVQIMQWLPAALPGELLSNFPSFLGVSLSTLLFGLGFMISWKASLTVMAGSVISYLVWVFDEGAMANTAYTQHSNNVWILTGGTSIMIISAIMSLWGMRAIWIKFFREITKDSKFKAGEIRLKLSFLNIILALAMLGTLIVFYILKPSLNTVIAIVVVLFPMTLVAILFSSRSSGETGLSPITPLGIITFCIAGIILRDFKTIMYMGAFVCAAGLASTTMLNSIKTGDLLDTPKQDLVYAQLIGAVFGVFVGSFTVYIIGNLYTFGSEALPTPVSIAWGTMVDGISKGHIPQNINPAIGVAGAAAAILMTIFKISATSFGIGIIIPPSYSATLLLGGLFRCAIQNRYKKNKEVLASKLNDMQSAMAGLIVGEGIIVLASFFIKLSGYVLNQ